MRFFLFALCLGAAFFLSSCLSWIVHPLPPTLNNQPTRAWLERLYVRFDVQDPVYVDHWLRALSEQGAQVIAYQASDPEYSPDPFVKALKPTAVLDMSWHPHEIDNNTPGSSDTPTFEGRLKLQLTSGEDNVLLSSGAWTLQRDSMEHLDEWVYKAVQRWLTPKGSKRPHPPSPPTESNPWFTTPLVVLPFSDEVNNVEAAGLIRVIVFERLHLGGYAVVPLEEVDATLRQHGFTQGGQLKNVNPKQLAQWLGVSRLLYGHVDTFDNITLGIVGKRAVGGKLSLWDQAEGRFIWSNHGLAQDTDTVKHLKGGEILGHFIGQLASKWWGQLTHKPLEAESVDFVDGVLALPLLPPHFSDNLEDAP